MFKRRLAAVLTVLMLASIAMGAMAGPAFAGDDNPHAALHHK